MKPWEETWTAEGDQVDVGGLLVGSFIDPEPDETPYEHDIARARLAAAAPDMARVLLDVEWAGRSQYGEPRCPSCNGEPPRDDKPWRPSHAADCTLDAALRKAGVR